MALSSPASISSLPSIVLDASITDTLNAECGKPIQFGPDSYKPGAKSHKAQPGPSVWNGETITIPETGVYICIFSGTCETDGDTKSAQIHLNLRQVSKGVITIGSTPIDQEYCEKSIYRRVSKFEKGDEVWISATREDGRDVRITSAKWMFHHSLPL
ncbi:MAG TPA: hypothetical protein DE314_11300 [Sulfitobacter sp.]|nr:hypothetical protein [Sulfitobacter sp.]